MENNIDSPTNGSLESANLDNGDAGNTGDSLTGNTEQGLAQGAFGKPIKKASNNAGNKVPLYFLGEQASDSEVNAEPQTDSNDELDLSLLDGDSEQHTNVEDEGDSEPEQTFEIHVNGESFKVSQSELIADAQKYRASENKFREASNLQQEASNMRKEADELMAAYKQERETLKGLLNHYQSFIEQSYKAQEPNWDHLYQNDPLEYFKQKEIWQVRMQEVQLAKQHQEQVKAQEAMERSAKEAEFIKSQQKLMFEKFPSWKDEAVRNKAAQDIIGYLVSEGFAESDTHALTDVRLLQVAHKAAMYDKLVKANEAKKVKPTPSNHTLKAGAATNVDPGFKKRQAQTANAREAKAWKESLRNDPSSKNYEAYLKAQWDKKLK